MAQISPRMSLLAPSAQNSLLTHLLWGEGKEEEPPYLLMPFVYLWVYMYIKASHNKGCYSKLLHGANYNGLLSSIMSGFMQL